MRMHVASILHFGGVRAALLLCCLGTTICETSCGDDPSIQATIEQTSGDAESGALLQKEMFAHGESIRQGVFSGTEALLNIEPDGRETRGKARFTGAFDFVSGRIRFDYKSETDRERDYHYFESPESRVIHSVATGYKIFRGPVERHRDRPAEFFDVRCIGMVTETEVGMGLLPNIKERIEESDVEMTGRKIENSTRSELVKTTAKGIGYVRHELDAEKDYAPILLELRFRQKDGKTSEVSDKVTVEWEQRNGIWVPRSVAFERPYRKGGSKIRRLEFEWQTVNKAVPDFEFDHKTLVLPIGTRIVDHATDPANPVLVEIVGEPSGINVPKK